MATLSWPTGAVPDRAPADAAPEAFALIDGRGSIVGASEGFSACLGHPVGAAALVGRSIDALLSDVLARPDAIEVGVWLQEVRGSAGEGRLHRTAPLRLYGAAGQGLVLTGQCAAGARIFLRVERVAVPDHAAPPDAATAEPPTRAQEHTEAEAGGEPGAPSAAAAVGAPPPTAPPPAPEPGRVPPLGAVLDGLSDTVFVTDRSGHLLIANEASRDFFSRPVRTLVGLRAADLVPRELGAALSEADIVVRETGQPMRFTRALNVALGHWRDYEILKAPLRTVDGLLVGVVTTARDITVQDSQIRQGLEQARLLDALLTHIPYFVFWKDRDLVYQGCSQNFADIFAAGSRSGVIGGTDRDVLPLGAEAETFRRGDTAVMTTGTPLLDVHRIVHRPDGRPMHLVVSTVALRDRSGAVTGVLSVARDVTAARRTEAERDRLSRIMQALLQLPVVIFQTDDTGTITERLGSEVCGDPDVVGKDVFRLLPGAAGPLRDALTQRRTVRFEVADDRRGWALDMVFGPDRPGGRGYLGVGLDVTERRRAERALRERDRLLRSIIATIPVVISAVDRDGVIVLSEGRALALLGRQPGKGVGTAADVVWADHPEVVEALERARRGEDVVLDLDLGEAALQMHLLPMADDEDDALGPPHDRRRPRPALLLAVDITERRRAERLLERSEDTFRSAFIYASHGMALADCGGRLLRVNPTLAEITGYDEAALLAASLGDLADSQDASLLRDHFGALTEGRRAGGLIEVRLRRRDGLMVWAQLAGAVVRDADGVPRQVIVHVQDVTDRRRAEARFRAMFEKATIGLALLDAEGCIVTANDALCRILGDDKSALLGRRAEDLVPVPALGTWRSWREVVGGRKLGEPPPPWLRIGRHAFADGRAEDATSILMVEDSSEVRALEDQLAHLSKLTALGEMAASLAHEINQPLNTARLVAEAILEDLRHDKEAVRVRKAFETIHGQTQRIAEIIHHVRQFGRRDGDKPRPFDPVAVARTVVKLYRHEARKARVALDVQMPRTGPLILGHTVRFEQMLINLLSNALDAVRARHAEGGQGRIGLTVRLEAETRTVVLAVVDNGGGIPTTVRERIFEPFFTTKPADKGTGLGLAICLTIAAEMNGRIDVLNPPDGARIEVRLPVPETPQKPALPLAPPFPPHHPPVAAPAPARGRSPRPRGKPLAGLSVLVVDDETQALHAVARSLRSHGVHVVTARNGRDAFVLFQEHQPDAVVTDLTMPEGSGEELVERIAEAAPGQPVVVMTGRPVGPEPWRAHVAEVLSKPVGLSQLRQVLKDLLRP
ncbi:PAS domain S-box protein [Caenispirillum bisanense]|uniref:histidine kinase n=1 Tax=Caenispirillum bisanense TaxID=414052 RepID=A0A286H1D4_9PROT|nr:PAS domain S-box protein [Caenispirillum bisanense]SOE01266.1 PAS domain S-box-containing protein [Caenispirillum bisanense]